MNTTVTGVLQSIGEEQTISDKFKKREIVIEESDTKFPNIVMLELTQDRTDMIDAYKVGEVITVEANVRCRQWTNPQDEVKHFVSLNVWKIQKVDGGQETAESVSGGNASESDLPF